MCVILFKPYGTTITIEELIAAAEINPDGIGIASNNGIHKFLYLHELEDTNILIDSMKEDTNSIFHFRIKTGAPMNIRNCHPFSIGNNKFLFHNGVCGRSTDITDSEIFSNSLFNKSKDYIRNSITQEHYKSRSKFVIWDNNSHKVSDMIGLVEYDDNIYRSNANHFTEWNKLTGNI